MKLFLALAAASLAFTPAFAEENPPTARVEYKDLDLSTKAGRATLDRRIEAAARSVCPSVVTTGTRIRRSNDCIDNAIASVKQSLAARGVRARTASR